MADQTQGRYVACIFLATLLLPSTAHAACMSADAWLGKIGAGLAPAASLIDHTDLSDDLRQAAAVEFNQTPPVGAPIMPERAVVTIIKSTETGFPLPFVLIGFFVHGCAAGTMRVPIVGGGDG